MYSASRFASPAPRVVYLLSGPCEVLAAAEASARLSPGVMPSESMETQHWLPLALGVGPLPDVIGAAASASDVSISLLVPSDTDSPFFDALSLFAVLASRPCPLPLPSPTTEGFDRVIKERPERTWAQVTFLVIITFSRVHVYALTLSRRIFGRA